MTSSARLYLSPPHMSGREQAYVTEAFETNWVAPVGPHLERFEREFAAKVQAPYAVAVASGTAALHLALRAVGVSAGDRVVCSSFTFCASANPICYEYAQPVFLDSDRISWNMDPNLLHDELAESNQRNRLPKAIIAVDILGQSADLDAIRSEADRFEIPVIEDAAEALGASYRDKPVGASCPISTFSFNGNKIITTSGGGMLCAFDQALADKIRFWSTQSKEPGPIYLHKELGFNYRLSNVLAGVGIGQLEVLDERVAKRRQIMAYYKERLGQLPGIGFMPRASFGQPNDWLSVITVDAAQFGASCDDIRLALETDNIESRRLWLPLHMQPLFANCEYRGGSVAESAFETGLCLPSGTAMTDHDLDRVCLRIEAVHASRPAT